MTEKTLEIMEELTQIVGISGDEKEVSKALAVHYKGLCDEVIYDNLGSIFAVKKCGKENAKRVMVCAHMDDCHSLRLVILPMGQCMVQELL